MPWDSTPWGAHFAAAGSPPRVLLILSPCAFQEEDVEAEEGTSLDSSSAVTGRRMLSLRSGTHSMALISTVGLTSRTHLVRNSTPSSLSSAEGCCRRLKDQTVSPPASVLCRVLHAAVERVSRLV